MILVAILCFLSIHTFGSAVDKDIDWSKVRTINNNFFPNNYVLQRQSTEIENKIVGGSETGKPIPYQVGFLIQAPLGELLCGGALISSKHILSAAHCFYSIVPVTPSVLAFFGAYNLTDKHESSQFRQFLTRSEVLFHPLYDPNTVENDIVIITLIKLIKFTDHIQPISLPSADLTVHNLKGKLATASGWGLTFDHSSEISPLLREVNLEILSQPQCRSFFDILLQETNICTDGKSSKGPCNGDSGGPLVIHDKVGKKPILVGLTSFGHKIGCQKGWPTIYTRVGAYMGWIKSNMNN